MKCQNCEESLPNLESVEHGCVRCSCDVIYVKESGKWTPLISDERRVDFKNGLLFVLEELKVIYSQLSIKCKPEVHADRVVDATDRSIRLIKHVEGVIRGTKPDWEEPFPSFVLRRDGVDKEKILDQTDLALGWYSWEDAPLSLCPCGNYVAPELYKDHVKECSQCYDFFSKMIKKEGATDDV